MSPRGLCHPERRFRPKLFVLEIVRRCVHLLRRTNYKRLAAVGFNQTVSKTNKYGGRSHGNYERTCENCTDSRGPAVTRLLACDDRQSSDQRDGPGNGEAVS